LGSFDWGGNQRDNQLFEEQKRKKIKPKKFQKSNPSLGSLIVLRKINNL